MLAALQQARTQQAWLWHLVCMALGLVFATVLLGCAWRQTSEPWSMRHHSYFQGPGLHLCWSPGLLQRRLWIVCQRSHHCRHVQCTQHCPGGGRVSCSIGCISCHAGPRSVPTSATENRFQSTSIKHRASGASRDHWHCCSVGSVLATSHLACQQVAGGHSGKLLPF